MLKQQIHCLLIGDEQHQEWREVTEWLARHVHLVIHESPTATLSAFQASDTVPSFDLIILAQSHPGQFDSEEVDSLCQKWPAAKMLALCGTWCEGEGRTGRPWPGVWRVHAGNCIRVLRQLFDVERPRDIQPAQKSITGRRRTQRDNAPTEQTAATNVERTATRRSRSWLLPRSITDAERIYYDAAEPLIHGEGTVLISAASPESYATLADAVGQAGFNSLWQSPDKGECPEKHGSDLKTAGAIVDMLRGSSEEWQAAHKTASRIAPARLLVLLGFPRSGDFKAAETISAAVYGQGGQIVVLPKPFRLNDLCTELTRMTGIIGTTRALETPA